MTATLTLDMKKSRMRIHKQTLHLLNEPPYIWVNPKEKTIALCAGDEKRKDAIQINSNREAEVYSSGLFYELRRLNRDMQDDCSYRIEGKIIKDNTVAEFDVLNVIRTQDHKRMERNG